MTVRFFLGLMESIIGPVFVIITSNWWTRPEQAFRTAFWLGGTPGPIATWKLFFLFFGSLSFAFSFVLMYFMPDNQANTRWLSERERKVAIERVRENRTVTSDNHWKWDQFWEALKDPQTTFFFITAV
ncbi:putative transporter C757.13 [Colletotrichum liriopes]|uniref:Transporter C757.13 n=1 Tax=Colletotrichum liriopes TaxID=708192 RepID=A0AA37GPA6_9PEZI|nr:putative transporter C757.13 [Colletotrichum liriopes]